MVDIYRLTRRRLELLRVEDRFRCLPVAISSASVEDKFVRTHTGGSHRPSNSSQRESEKKSLPLSLYFPTETNNKDAMRQNVIRYKV